MSAIVSPNGPDVTITITLDTKTNDTKIISNKPVNRLILIALLLEHATGLTRQEVIVDMQKSKSSPVIGGA